MTKSAKQVLEQAMALDLDDRAELVEQLSDTLEPSTDPEYVAAWEAELRRRIDAHESGESKGIPWEEARKQIFDLGTADAEDEDEDGND
jgi:putative addiction module component (TIGR02574 family)